MNQFLELRLSDGEGFICVRPEHVSAVVYPDGDPYVVVRLSSGDAYAVEPGQFTLNKLINHTGHAGMRVLK